MPRLSKEKLKNLKNLYESGKLTLEEMEGKTGITKKTIEKYAADNQWKAKSVLPTNVEDFGENIIAKYEAGEPIEKMVDNLLPDAIWVIQQILNDAKKNKSNRPGLRDATALLTKLIEIKGKITGELAGTQITINEHVERSFAQMNQFMEMLGDKGITGLKPEDEDVYELEDYKVEVIE